MIISAAKATEAAQTLGVELQGLTPDALSQAYRTKSKDCHPDHHGAERLELWARVSWAKEALTHWLKSQTRLVKDAVEEPEGGCRACGGLGRIKLSSNGFGKGLTKVCVMCNGSGTLQAGEAHYGGSE